ncbi:MAG: hypothetical protein ACYDBB_03380 [Armatimonadota bacterium]
MNILLNTRWAYCVGTLALLLTAWAPVRACYSGLVLIPTADMVGANNFSLDAQVDGSLPECEVDLKLLNTQFGFGDRFEAGVDFDLSDNADTRALFNAKYLLATYQGGKGALAVGTSNIGNHLTSLPYLVATQDLTALRGHAGVIRIDGRNRWFVGADRALNEQCTLMGDYTHGEENYSSLGLEYCPNDRWSVLAGVQFPNEGGATRFSMHLVFGGVYRQAQKD